MILYTDAGLTHQFKYFIFTDRTGRVLGYKLNVARPGDVPPELEGVIAAIYWARLRGGKVKILTDERLAEGLVYASRSLNPRLAQYQTLVKKLLKNANIKIHWIPREVNVAGRVLSYMSKKGDADSFLEYFKKAR